MIMIMIMTIELNLLQPVSEEEVDLNHSLRNDQMMTKQESSHTVALLVDSL